MDLRQEVDYRKSYTGEQLLLKVWEGWPNEAQPDIIGVLACGPAAR